MAAYSHFLGGPVKVHYRQGDILLSATGTFVADSGRSIFLEQHLEQRGKLNYFRWEIPYPYIHRVEHHSRNTESLGDRPLSKAAAASAGPTGAAPRSDSTLPYPPARENS